MSESGVQSQIAFGRREELANIVSHAVGAALMLAGLVFLLIKTGREELGALAVFSVLVYGISVIAMFTVSVVYHSVRAGSKARDVARRIDKCMIAVLVFGTYAPVTLIGFMRGGMADVVWGYVLFAVSFASSTLSVIFNSVSPQRFKLANLILAAVLAWACVIRADRIAALCDWTVFWFMFGGAALYGLGAVFYVLKKVPFNHAIWHMFVIAGAALHFVGIYTFLL